MYLNRKKIVPELVSVVIPVYNQESFIAETVKSVLDQTYQNLEIILTDDGSSDGSVSIIKELERQNPDRVIVVLSKKNTGIAKNFNRGLEKVRGEYIAWLGGDDLMLPTKIEKQVALLKNRKDAIGCIHDADVFESESGKSIGNFSVLYNGNKKYIEGGVELWFKSSYRMLPSTVMIRSLAVPDHGFDERLKFANDLLFDIEVFRNGRCAVINQVLGKYRRHAGNVTESTELRSTVVEEVLLVLSIVESRYPELYKYTRKRRTGLFIKESVVQYKNGNKRLSFAYLKIAIKNGSYFMGTGLYLALLFFGDRLTKNIKANRYENKSWIIRLMRLMTNE